MGKSSATQRYRSAGDITRLRMGVNIMFALLPGHLLNSDSSWPQGGQGGGGGIQFPRHSNLHLQTKTNRLMLYREVTPEFCENARPSA